MLLPICDTKHKDPRECWHTPGAWFNWLESNMMDATARAHAWAKLLSHRTITESGCWEWNSTRSPAGYGRINLDKSRAYYMTHRVAASLVLGLDLQDSRTLACHHCDNPPCFNPEHLFLGTARDNNYDRIAKGRTRVWTGPRPVTKYPKTKTCEICGAEYTPAPSSRSRSKTCSKPCANEYNRASSKSRTYKLDAAKVLEIRAAQGHESGRKVAARMGIHQSAVYSIWNGQIWRDVTLPGADPLPPFIPATITPGDGDPRHGTKNGYANLKCRCDACRAANAVRVAHYWARGKAKREGA